MDPDGSSPPYDHVLFPADDEEIPIFVCHGNVPGIEPPIGCIRTRTKGYLSPFDEEVRLSWDPTVETWTAFDRRTRAALEDYRTRTEAKAKQAGFQPHPERRNLEHFDWLVQWQVDKLGRKEIAQRANVSEDAVKKAVKRLANEMGLTLRLGSQFASLSL